MEQSLRVAVRVRPMQAEELGKEEVVICVVSGRQENTVRVSDENRFTQTTFDAVFTPDSKQEDVYQFVSEIVPGLLSGYNATVFAYGQTGSGKTFTMFGERWTLEDLGRLHQSTPLPLGLVPRVVADLFQSSETQQFTTYCSFIEIYNEKIFDLLQDNDKAMPLLIREDQGVGLFVEGLAEYVVQNSRDCLLLMKRGERNRAIRSTRMNRNSSRSHCIFQLSMERDKANQSGLISRAKLNLCDLAGSEKFDKVHEMAKQHLLEMNKINLSLTTLGKVITCLAQNKVHVPYRDSKLTRLLMDSLGGNTRTCFIATVSPVVDCLDETISTLNFASRAKNIRQTVTKNEISATDDKLVTKLQREIRHLKELLQLKKKGNAGRAEIQQRLWLLTEENERLRALSQSVTQQEVERLKEENKRMRLELQKLYDSGTAATPSESHRNPQSDTPLSTLLNESKMPQRLGDLTPLLSTPVPEFLQTADITRTIDKSSSIGSVVTNPRMQIRIRDKHNLVLTKTAAYSDVLMSKEAIRQKEELRRTRARLQNLERMEAIQQERIRAEMRRVEEEESKQVEDLEFRDREKRRKRAYFENQKEKVKSYSEEKDRKRAAEQAKKQTQIELEKLKYKYRAVPPLLQPCLKPKPNRLEVLLRESV